MIYRYAPGSWFAIASGESLVLLEESVSQSAVDAVWRAMRRGGGFGALLDSLTDVYGATFTAIPSFVLVDRVGTALRTVVRGAASVESRDRAGGSVTVGGCGVTTWNERLLPDPTEVRIRVEGEPDADAVLPLVDGAVMASLVLLKASATVETIPSVPAASLSTVTEAVSVPAPSPMPGHEPEPHDVPVGRAASGTETEPDPVPALLPQPAPEVLPTPAVLAAPEPMSEPDPPQHNTPASVPPGSPAAADDGATLGATVFEAEVNGYDRLWGETVISTVEDAAVREDPEALIDQVPAFTAAPVASVVDDDHDGETMSLARLRELQAASGGAAVAPSAAAPSPAPTTGRVVLSTGVEVSLDQDLVIGRRPHVTRVSGASVPRLVTVPSPNQDISRNHLELKREASDVVALDLGTTNGTRLIRTGRAPERLRANSPVVLVSGDVLDLGDGISLTVEGLS